jgi:hypothetical protein
MIRESRRMILGKVDRGTSVATNSAPQVVNVRFDDLSIVRNWVLMEQEAEVV